MLLVAMLCDVDPLWLAFGKGEMIPPILDAPEISTEALTVARAWDSLPEVLRGYLIAHVDNFVKLQKLSPSVGNMVMAQLDMTRVTPHESDMARETAIAKKLHERKKAKDGR